MINLNGLLREAEAAKLSVFNRGFTYGDAVFETIRIINGKIMFWEDHYFRLMASMRIMRMEIPQNFSPEFLEKELLDIVEANELLAAPARVKLIVFREEGGLYSPKSKEVGYVIAASDIESSFYLLSTSPYEIELFKDHYMNSGLLSTVKTNNRAVNILGGVYAQENEYDNCLLLNERKNVVEALNANLFLVNGNTIKTPPLSDGCIKGITRGAIIEIVSKLPEYTLVEESVSPFELQKGDELFLTNVIMGIRPVSKYRKKEFGSEVAKDLLSKLNAKARLT